MLGLSVKQANGSYLIRGHADQPDPINGSLDLWVEYLCGSSPVVVEDPHG